ncbi:hypothetical protein C0995_003625 [Termitomyces sp. Mi166|nr:hypothetical protein C0995_003625 [Termitomyces sp. Mi166\
MTSYRADSYPVRSIARPGETISSYRYERRVGGKGANQATAIIRAGGIADFYGSVGEDGLWVKDTVATFGLDPRGISVSNVPTGRALIQISDSGENSISELLQLEALASLIDKLSTVLFPGANFSQLTEETWETSSIAFPECTHILLQNEIHMESTLYALNNSNDATTIYNPSPMPSSKEINEFPWDKVDWLIVNEGEAEDLYRVLSGHGSTTSLEKSPKEVLLLLSAQPALVTTNIICTLGKDGVIAFVPAFHRTKRDHVPSFIHLPAAVLKGSVRDTTGAGDCFTGYFVQGLMEFGPQAKPRHGIEESDIVNILKTCVQVRFFYAKYFSGRSVTVSCVRQPACVSRDRGQLIAYRQYLKLGRGFLINKSRSYDESYRTMKGATMRRSHT